MADRDEVRIVVEIPGLSDLPRVHQQLGVLVASVDDVLTKLGQLGTELTEELAELRALIEAGRVDQAKLDQAASMVDDLVARADRLVEDAQTPAEEPPPNGGEEPAPV